MNNGRKVISWKVMWIASGVLTVVAILVMYVTHRAIPFMMDDLWYATLLYEDTPIASLGDIVKSQVWHYYNWGGRSLTHGILQLTLLAGEQAADVLNVAFTLLLAGMICLVSDNRKFPAFCAAVIMPLGLNANWRMSMFWQAGAANYLYITVFLLGFLYCYLREVPEESCTNEERCSDTGGLCQKEDGEQGASEIAGRQAVRPLPGIVLWIVPLGILAGWSNENMGPAVWCISGAVIVLVARKRRRVRLWMLLGNLACLAGSVICIAAPGNAVRSAQVGDGQLGGLWRLFLRCYAECKGAMEFLFPTLLVLGFMVILCKCVLKCRLGWQNVLLLAGALLSWGAFILSPHYPDRAAFGTMVLCICVILSLAKKIVDKRHDAAWPLWGIGFFLWLKAMYLCGEYLAIVWGWL